LFSPGEQELSKLVPELRLAVTSNSRFVGFGTQGRSLLAFDDTVGHLSILNILRKVGASAVAPLTLSEDKSLKEVPVASPDAESRRAPTIVTELVILADVNQAAEIQKLGAHEITERSGELGFLTFNKSGGFDATEILALARDDNVEFIEPNYPVFLFSDPPNDTSSS
jgi:hypothetical protein